MYCSVKFFEPTVISMPLLSGFSSIRFALISLPASSVLPPVPQAATPSARRSAARSANSGRGRVWMLIWDSSLVGDVLVVGERSGLCDRQAYADQGPVLERAASPHQSMPPSLPPE